MGKVGVSHDVSVHCPHLPSSPLVNAAQQVHTHAVGDGRLRVHHTHSASFTAPYRVTRSLRCQAIPGVIEHQGARIQLLDLPGIVEGASEGRGRGRQVVATAKTADLILIMLDATKSEEQRRLLEIELDAVGIRLNKKKPDVVFKRKTTGGVSAASVP